MDVSRIKQNYLNRYCAFFAHMHVRFWRLKWVTLYQQNHPLKLQSSKRGSHLNLELTFGFHCWCVDENVFKRNSLTLVEVRLFHLNNLSVPLHVKSLYLVIIVREEIQNFIHHFMLFALTVPSTLAFSRTLMSDDITAAIAHTEMMPTH